MDDENSKHIFDEKSVFEEICDDNFLIDFRKPIVVGKKGIKDCLALAFRSAAEMTS